MSEKGYNVEMPNEETLAGLFAASPYFIDLFRRYDMFFFPEDLNEEECLLVPILNEKSLQDYIRKTEIARKREEIPLAALVHVPSFEDYDEEEEDDEDEDGLGLVSLFDGPLQMELVKFFQTTVSILNPEVSLSESFEEMFDSLMMDCIKDGYLDKVLDCVAEFVGRPEVMTELLFPSEDEEE